MVCTKMYFAKKFLLCKKIHYKWSKQFHTRSHRRRRRTVQLYLPGGANVPSHWRHLANAIEHVLPWAQPNPSDKSISSAVFAPLTTESPHTLQCDVPLPWKLFLSMRGDLDPHLTHGSLGLPESSTQAASRSVQPFLQGSLVWQRDRQTDRQTTLLGR